ncbi:MAG: nitrite reductase small subunit NirD [Nocardioidaceae bacterium]
MTARTGDETWTPVCALDQLPVERGVTALVRGHAVAVFLVPDGSVYVLGNHDPFSRSTVLGRGIVGSRDDIPFVASPSSRRAFDLRSGVCLDEPGMSVPAYAVKVVDGVVHVGGRNHP